MNHIMNKPQAGYTEAYCSYKVCNDGELILEDADHSYLCLAGLTIEALGRTSQELGDTRPGMLLRLCRMTGFPVTCLHDCGGSPLRIIRAELSGEHLVCRSFPADLSGELSYCSDGSEKFTGTLTAVLRDNVLTAEAFSSGAEELLKHPKPFTPVTAIFGKIFDSADISALTEKVLDDNSPEELILTLSPAHGTPGAVHITAYPVISQEKRIIFTFYSKEYSRRREPVSCLAAAGKVCISGRGGYFTVMTDYLAAMLGSGSISAGEIFAAASSACEAGSGITLSGRNSASVFAYPDENGRDSAYVAAYENDTAADGYGISFPQLTKREYTIVHLAADGLSNAGIGERLGISEGTVSKILYNSYRKLNISSRVDAAGLF